MTTVLIDQDIRTAVKTAMAQQSMPASQIDARCGLAEGTAVSWIVGPVQTAPLEEFKAVAALLGLDYGLPEEEAPVTPRAALLMVAEQLELQAKQLRRLAEG